MMKPTALQLHIKSLFELLNISQDSFCELKLGNVMLQGSKQPQMYAIFANGVYDKTIVFVDGGVEDNFSINKSTSLSKAYSTKNIFIKRVKDINTEMAVNKTIIELSSLINKFYDMPVTIALCKAFNLPPESFQDCEISRLGVKFNFKLHKDVKLHVSAYSDGEISAIRKGKRLNCSYLDLSDIADETKSNKALITKAIKAFSQQVQLI